MESNLNTLLSINTSLVAQTVKNLLAGQDTWVQFLSREDPVGKGMATHSSILAMDRGAWATIHGVSESDRTERLTLSHP